MHTEPSPPYLIKCCVTSIPRNIVGTHTYPISIVGSSFEALVGCLLFGEGTHKPFVWKKGRNLNATENQSTWRCLTLWKNHMVWPSIGLLVIPWQVRSSWPRAHTWCSGIMYFVSRWSQWSMRTPHNWCLLWRTDDDHGHVDPQHSSLQCLPKTSGRFVC